jgi:hypothetical protein
VHADRVEAIQGIVCRCVDAAFTRSVHLCTGRSYQPSKRDARSLAPSESQINVLQLGLIDESMLIPEQNGLLTSVLWQPQGNVSSHIRFEESLYAVTDVNGNIALLPSMSLLPSTGYWGLKSAPLPIAIDLIRPFRYDARVSLISKFNCRGLNRGGAIDTNMFAYPALHSAYPWIRSVANIEVAQIVRNIQWKHISFLPENEISTYVGLKGHIEAKIQQMVTNKSTKLSNLRAAQYHTRETRSTVVEHHLHSLLLGQMLQCGSCSDIVSACLSETDLIPKLGYLVSQPWQMQDELLSLHPVNRYLNGLSRDYHRMMKAYRPMSMYNRIASASIEVLNEAMQPRCFAVPSTTTDILCRRSQFKCQLASMKSLSDQKLLQRADKPFLPPRKRIREAVETSRISCAYLRSYEAPLVKRIRSRIIMDDPQSVLKDHVAEASDEPQVPKRDLLLYLKRLAEQKLMRREEVTRRQSVLRSRFAPCALVAMGIILEELVSEMMCAWTNRADEGSFDSCAGPLKFSERALEVEIDLQLEGCDINFMTEEQLQSRLQVCAKQFIFMIPGIPFLGVFVCVGLIWQKSR